MTQPIYRLNKIGERPVMEYAGFTGEIAEIVYATDRAAAELIGWKTIYELRRSEQS